MSGEHAGTHADGVPPGASGTPDTPPHCDPARFDAVVAGIAPEALLVVLDREMGPAVRAQCTAEDVLQEALAHAWRDRAQHRWEGPRAFRAWVLAIAKNRIRDLARAASREKRGGGERPALFSALASADGGGVSELLPPGSQTPSRIVAARERATILAEALASLPEDLREVVRKHHFEERSLHEIAAEEGVAHHVVRHRFRKGLLAFAERVEALRSRSRS